MRIDNFGPGDFLSLALFDSTGARSVALVSATPTQVVIRNPVTGAVSTFLGSGFTADPIANPGGVVSSWTIVNAQGRTIASVTAMQVPVLDFVMALDALATSNDFTLFNQLLSQAPLTVDSSTSVDGAGFLFDGVTSDITLIGSAFGDTLGGGSGNDSIDPGITPVNGRDVIYGSMGNDVVNFSAVLPNRGYIQLTYADIMAGGITAAINGAANTGSIGLTAGTTTLVNVNRALDADTDGFALFGTAANDTFTITGGAGSYIGVGGSEGNDTFNLALTGDIRLIYDGSWHDYALQGVVVNLATGVVANDGFGGTDTLNITDGAGWLEVYASNLSDLITGSNRASESYILLGGNDTLHAGGGFDLLRFDRNAFTAGVAVDLAVGTATGYTGLNPFSHSISGVEAVRGTAAYNDTLQGSVGADTFEGLGGNDILRGGDGADTLWGGDGADTLNGGTGDDFIFGGDTSVDLRDVIYGGDGNDSVDGGHGNDLVFGGNGNDSVEGGFGVDEIQGQAGNDVLTGSAFSDLIFGGDGNDFVNGGFGHDRVNGGAGADRFYHLGVAGHGSDWIQDYRAAQGDVLLAGINGATRSQFQVNLSETAGAGAVGGQEAFVIYRPTGQILWALVDGGAEAHINLQIGAQVFDLLA